MTRRALSLFFLAVIFTGFILLPALFDPEVLRAKDGASIQATAKPHLLFSDQRTG